MMSLVTERRFRQRLEELSIVWHVNNHQPALAWAAAAVTWVAAPERDIMTIPKQLDALADALWKWADETGQPEPLTIEAVAEGFVALGFRGNTENYDDRRNSFLEDVLTRRVGIPITLSVVFIELARRFGLRCEGINFPGHFLVRYSGPDGVGYLDPFHQCQWLDSDGLQQLLQQMCGPIFSCGCSTTSTASALKPKTGQRPYVRAACSLSSARRTPTSGATSGCCASSSNAGARL
jgi:regulator of sirC expression with transglutaminase-like and TPR domain